MLLSVSELAEKLPLLSRATMAPETSELVAPLAAMTALATFVAACPPMDETAVALCVPVTSPASEPEKLPAVVAIVAEVALLALVAVVAVAATPAFGA